LFNSEVGEKSPFAHKVNESNRLFTTGEETCVGSLFGDPIVRDNPILPLNYIADRERGS